MNNCGKDDIEPGKTTRTVLEIGAVVVISFLNHDTVEISIEKRTHPKPPRNP